MAYARDAALGSELRRAQMRKDTAVLSRLIASAIRAFSNCSD
jgi:hypothetical protein